MCVGGGREGGFDQCPPGQSDYCFIKKKKSVDRNMVSRKLSRAEVDDHSGERRS